ncbi:MAG: hypothetical protein O7C59_01920 [Rickettsia endosymbiont of Ixodes persulcatus]|nr:hypothetical protein [Rickettsia endosymbiont of Ixodes persulcatus]MCZ6913375.1 hypothetical protein [Rickettsia endosymbiont of Ixodes persulcatus]MCZ6924791.1 hypothetical protein [Rickettsia endosymbiont of Ixodes persulcatus]
MVLVMLTHHGAHGKLKLFHLEDGGFNHQRDYKKRLDGLCYKLGLLHGSIFSSLREKYEVIDKAIQ